MKPNPNAKSQDECDLKAKSQDECDLKPNHKTSVT